MSQEEIASETITSFHKNQLNKMVDECTNKVLDFESAKMLKEAIELSMNQICAAFFEYIKKK